MSTSEYALSLYLKAKNAMLYGKALELEPVITEWLSYIPQTFPHYTRHTASHSKEIILQLSKILFHEEDPRTPVVPLSGVEAYVLLVAAFLHDAGMVAADAEKLAILRSDDWKAWTSGEGSGARRFREIERLRNLAVAGDSAHHFASDVQLRFLIAEFLRRTHHVRAGSVIMQHEASLGRFALNDPVLKRSVSDICLGHGLDFNDLENDERYPDRRDILGEPANVRLLAVLLRLGDLLDISSDRACSLLLNAACPLPADSYAHWSQYRRITHRSTAPDRISLTAECDNDEEHRLLHDWCSWIASETRNANALAARFARHSTWRAPLARLDGPSPTINIKPSATATYVPSRWVFHLDQDQVFERLVRDVYDEPLSFVRELLQNALDATRCRMSVDLEAEDMTQLSNPARVDVAFRRRYAIRIELQNKSFHNALSGEQEVRQVLTVSDDGIGMDSEIIEKFFLQVGRSFYTTDAFRQRFRFTPTSQFGVGFLSVFGVSDNVTVETFKPTSLKKDGPIKLTLTGPRSYFLVERGNRRASGTEVQLVLREPIAPGDLTAALWNWCKRVEFGIVVREFGGATRIEAERSDDFVSELPVAQRVAAYFRVQAVPIDIDGIDGEIYIASYTDNDGDSWAEQAWSQGAYLETAPGVAAPPQVKGLTCLHGISIGYGVEFGPISVRMDMRKAVRVAMSRHHQMAAARSVKDRYPYADVRSRVEKLLVEHLRTAPRAAGEDGWGYRQRLAGLFDFEEFWARWPAMLRIMRNRRVELSSLDAVTCEQKLTILMRRSVMPSGIEQALDLGLDGLKIVEEVGENALMLESDLLKVCSRHKVSIFSNRTITAIRQHDDGMLSVDWSISEKLVLEYPGCGPFVICPFPDKTIVGTVLHRTTNIVYDILVLNHEHPLVAWFKRLTDAPEIRIETIQAVAKLICVPCRYPGHELALLEDYIAKWSALGLSKDLEPPKNAVNRESFLWPRLKYSWIPSVETAIVAMQDDNIGAPSTEQSSEQQGEQTTVPSEKTRARGKSSKSNEAKTKLRKRTKAHPRSSAKPRTPKR